MNPKMIPTTKIMDYRNTGKSVFEKKCQYENCGNTFYPVRKDAKFCSNSCRCRYHFPTRHVNGALDYSEILILLIPSLLDVTLIYLKKSIFTFINSNSLILAFVLKCFPFVS